MLEGGRASGAEVGERRKGECSPEEQEGSGELEELQAAESAKAATCSLCSSCRAAAEGEC